MFLKPDERRINTVIYSYLINTLVVLTIFLIANYHNQPMIVSIAMMVSHVLAPFSLWIFIAFRYDLQSLTIFALSLVLWYMVVCVMGVASDWVRKKWKKR